MWHAVLISSQAEQVFVVVSYLLLAGFELDDAKFEG
jgi:hypothetical protein